MDTHEKNKVIECKNVYKKIGRKQILQDISLYLLQGDILGLIGPNGAGKTTLIKLMLRSSKYHKREDFNKWI